MRKILLFWTVLTLGLAPTWATLAAPVYISGTIRIGSGPLLGRGEIEGYADLGIIDIYFYLTVYYCSGSGGECGGIVTTFEGDHVLVDMSEAAYHFPAERSLLPLVEQAINAGQTKGRVMMNTAPWRAVQAAEQFGYGLRAAVSSGQPLTEALVVDILSGIEVTAFQGTHFGLAIWDYDLQDGSASPFLYTVEIQGQQ